MIVLGWNCRGLGNLRSVRALREIVQRWDPNIVFLSETKLNKKGMEKIKGKAGFSNGLIIPKSDRSGGMAMLWKKDIKLEIVGYAGNYIDALVVESQSGFKWRITGFYGHPETHRRKESWDQLRVLHRKAQLPWICFGDFNEISSAREKLGGARRPQKQIDDFVATIDSCGFRDLGFSGPDFTWCNMRDFSEAALRILNEGAVRDLEIFAVAAWSIWYNRNQKCFEDKPHPHRQVWHLAKRLISEQKEANASLNGNLVSEGLRWLPPPPEFHKINVDGASSDDGRRSSIGAVIRNCKGETVAALCKMLPGQYSSLETEFLAIQEGVLLARELELSQIIIESDSLIAIQCLNALNTDGGWGHLCQGILNLMDVFRSWNFKHLKRDYNMVAHDLAQHSRCYGISQVWKGAIPPMVQHLIHLESITASQPF